MHGEIQVCIIEIRVAVALRLTGQVKCHQGFLDLFNAYVTVVTDFLTASLSATTV